MEEKIPRVYCIACTVSSMGDKAEALKKLFMIKKKFSKQCYFAAIRLQECLLANFLNRPNMYVMYYKIFK